MCSTCSKPAAATERTCSGSRDLVPEQHSAGPSIVAGIVAWGAYLSLLVIWLLFVAPAVAPSHRARGWSRAAAGLGLAAALWESVMAFVWGPAAIRIDIFVLFALLAAVYLLASRSLVRTSWRRTGLTAGGLTLVAALAFGGAMAQIGGEMARNRELHEEGNRLLFAAKFADQAAYDAYFGATTEATGGVPAGHWTGEGAWAFTRLVVGGDDRAYLFVRCGDTETECLFGPGAPLEPRGDGFAAELVWRGVGQRALELDAAEGDTLAMRLDGKPYRLRRTPPPLLGLPRGERLTYLGAFSGTDPIRQHVRVAQLWLWRGDEGLFAVGIFSILLPGRHEEFVSPIVLGRGIPEGDAWRFTWTHWEETGEAIVRLGAQDVVVELTRLGRRDPWPPLRLTPRAIFRDEAIELASRRSAADWQHWMDTVLHAHFSSGDIPAN